MTAKPKSFLLYESYAELIERLSAQERGDLLTAIFAYARGDEVREAQMTTPVAIVFSIIRDGIDRDRNAYERKCVKNAENGRLGGRPKKSEKTERFFSKPKKANNNNNNNNNNNDNNNDNDNDNDNYNDDNEQSVALPEARGGAKEKRGERSGNGGRGVGTRVPSSYSSFDTDDFFEAALRRSEAETRRTDRATCRSE